MHILFVGHEYRANGASRSMINLIDELSDRCTFSVVLPYKDGPTIKMLKERGVDVYFVPFRRWAYEKNYKYYIKKILWLFRWDRRNDKLAYDFAQNIEGKNIDIIHSNTSVIDFGARLSRILKKPHVWHIREFGEKDFNIYPLVSYTRYYKTINSQSDVVCCISKAVSEKFIGNLNPDKVKVVYNGVGGENIIECKAYHNHGGLVCLQTGYINHSKGQEVSIKALQELYKRGIKDIVLLLAGKGSLERIGLKPDEVKGVKLLGVVDNLSKVREDVDIEIVSSKAEAFGRVTVEAMMGGIVVVGSNTGGTVELIDDGKTGLLYTQGDYIALADKVEYLYRNRELLSIIGSNAQRKAVKEYTISRCANDIYRIYRAVTNKGDNASELYN